MTTHAGYRETNVVDPETGLSTTFKYGFGRLRHDGFDEDPVLDDIDEDMTDEVEAATARADRVAGRYSSVDAAIEALIRAGYEADEVHGLEWY